MRGPLRRLSFAGLVTILLALPMPAAAQDEWAPVTYLDEAGTPLGTILIRGFADPYTEHDPASPPGEGLRYALLTLSFEAAEDQAFPTDPYQVQLLDAAGYVHYPQWVPRPPDSVVPDLQSQTLAPFDRISGVVPYVLPEQAQIVSIIYRGDGRRLMTIAELAERGTVATGEARMIADTAGTASGSITVREVLDPFTEFDPNGPPAEGMRYVVLDTAFEAAADQPLQASPGNVGLVADDGMLYWPSWVPRPQPMVLQNLESQPLSPGDRVSGVIGYAIPQAATIDMVVYNPEGNRYLPVVEP